MSKEFRPIFGSTETKTPETNFKDEVQKLREEKERAEARASELEERLNLLEKENRELLEEIKNLREELARREERLERALEELRAQELQRDIVEEISKRLEEKLEKVKEDLKGEFLELSKEMIKEFLLTDAVPKEELVTKILSDVFDKVVDLKGSVKVVLNPSDMDRVFEFIAGIRERLEGKVDIEVVGSEQLKPGELKIETTKFVIERKHEEILEEVFREAIRRVLERG